MWCVRVVSSPQNLVILPPSSKMVKHIFKKEILLTYSNSSPLVLSLGVYLREYLSCNREFLPIFKSTHSMRATIRANIYIYIYIHDLEVDQNLKYFNNNEKFSALTFLSKYRFTVAKHGLPASNYIKGETD